MRSFAKILYDHSLPHLASLPESVVALQIKSMLRTK
jgi:hypothetical protein